MKIKPLRVMFLGRLNPQIKPAELVDIKKASGLLEINYDSDRLEVVGELKPVSDGIRALWASFVLLDVVLPPVVLDGVSFSVVRRSIREGVEEGFSKFLESKGLPGCYGARPIRMITPRTQPKHFFKMGSQFAACLKCPPDLRADCSALTQARKLEEIRYFLGDNDNKGG